MAGVRQYNTSTLNTFRFPEWSSYVSYPVGSFVMHIIDGTPNFYVAVEDVPVSQNDPATNISDDTTVYWAAAFSSNAGQLSSQLNDLIDNLDDIFDALEYDSDIKELRHNNDGHESDIVNVRQFLDALVIDHDSDETVTQTIINNFYSKIDSETAVRNRMDSEYRNIVDSEVAKLNENLGSIIHDYEAIDSDVLIKKDFDSDLLAAVLAGDYYVDESDYSIITVNINNQLVQNFDSDVLNIIATNRSKYNVIDSEYVLDIQQEIYDYADAKALFYQSTNSITEFNSGFMTVRTDGIANNDSEITAVEISTLAGKNFADLGKYQFLDITARFDPTNSNTSPLSTYKYLLTNPNTANTACTLLLVDSYHAYLTSGQEVLANIAATTTATGISITADFEYSAGATSVSVVGTGK